MASRRQLITLRAFKNRVLKQANKRLKAFFFHQIMAQRKGAWGMNMEIHAGGLHLSQQKQKRSAVAKIADRVLTGEELCTESPQKAKYCVRGMKHSGRI